MMTIEKILAGESKNVEFKENLPEKSIKYMKSVVAFANGTGGKIIFGIADKTREVVGFDKEDVFKKMDAIRELIIDAMVHRSYLDHGTIQVAKMPDTTGRVPDSADKVPDTAGNIPYTIDKAPDTMERLPENEQEQQIYKYVLENSSIARTVLLNMVESDYLRKEGAARSTIYVKNTEER